MTLRAARGAGIVTSLVLQSDDLDEIDWEWLGGDNTQVQTNYFSKGCTETYDRGGFSPVDDPINQFHTYTIKWTPEQLDWIIDGNVVRTLKNTGIEGCAGYPQSPMQIKLGTWVAGRSDAPQGTIDWAGGLADFSQGPFDGYYQRVRIQDFMGARGATEATEYVYTDRSGKWESIKVVNDGDEVKPSTSATPTEATSTTTSSATTLSTVTSKPTSTPTSTPDDDDDKTTAATTATTADSDEPTDLPTPTKDGPGENAGVSPVPTSAPTGAAGKAALNMGNLAVVGAAAFLGYLIL